MLVCGQMIGFAAMHDSLPGNAQQPYHAHALQLCRAHSFRRLSISATVSELTTQQASTGIRQLCPCCEANTLRHLARLTQLAAAFYGSSSSLRQVQSDG